MLVALCLNRRDAEVNDSKKDKASRKLDILQAH